MGGHTILTYPRSFSAGVDNRDLNIFSNVDSTPRTLFAIWAALLQCFLVHCSVSLSLVQFSVMLASWLQGSTTWNCAAEVHCTAAVVDVEIGCIICTSVIYSGDNMNNKLTTWEPSMRNGVKLGVKLEWMENEIGSQVGVNAELN